MRICLVSREYPPVTLTGGIGAYTYKTSAALARLGHEVHVVTSSQQPAAEYTENGVFVHRLYETGDRRGLMPHSLAHAQAVAAAIARLPGRLDIVQACEWAGEAFWYACTPQRQARLVTRLATPHFLVERLNDANGAAPQRIFRRGLVTGIIEREQTRRSDGIISPTRALAQIVSATWRIAPERVTIVPTGANLGQSAALDAPVPQALRGEDYLLYFGRLERRKGVHVLGAALPAVLAAHPTFKAVFVGEDLMFEGQPMADVIRGLAAPYADRLIFLPRLPQQEMFPIIRAARVVVLPSLWENLANTCLEAMQLGRPVIATWGCGFEEVIEDGVSGFLTQPGDAASLAAGIEKALADEAMAERVGQAAEQRAQEFSIDAMVERLADYYAQLLLAGDRRTMQQLSPIA